MFQITLKPLTKSYLVAIITLLITFVSPTQAQSKYYDSEKGFKPAQKDMTEIMLQLAGSLEKEGSPEKYIRHMMSEHKRINALYAKVSGDTKTSSRPEHLTDENIELLLKNWKSIEKPLQLMALCKECGLYMRHTIRGSRNKTIDELVADESKLTKKELAQYRVFLEKEHFTKKDFPEMDVFYQDGGGYDKLTEQGKDQITHRIKLALKQSQAKYDAYVKNWNLPIAGTVLLRVYQKKYLESEKVNSDELKRLVIEKFHLNKSDVDWKKHHWRDQDAIRYSHYIKQAFQRRFDLVDKKLSPKGAKTVKNRMMDMVTNLRIIANSEMAAGMRESWVKKTLKAKN